MPSNHLILCLPLLLLPSIFPAPGSFPMSWLFVSGGQWIGASASASVFWMKIQGWFPLGLTSLISSQESSLTHNVIVFGDGHFREAIKAKWDIRVGLVRLRSMSEEEETQKISLSSQATGEVMWGHSKESAFYKPGRSFHWDLTTLASWSWIFYSPGIWEVNGSDLNSTVYGILL